MRWGETRRRPTASFFFEKMITDRNGSECLEAYAFLHPCARANVGFYLTWRNNRKRVRPPSRTFKPAPTHPTSVLLQSEKSRCSRERNTGKDFSTHALGSACGGRVLWTTRIAVAAWSKRPFNTRALAGRLLNQIQTTSMFKPTRTIHISQAAES